MSWTLPHILSRLSGRCIMQAQRTATNGENAQKLSTRLGGVCTCLGGSETAPGRMEAGSVNRPYPITRQRHVRAIVLRRSQLRQISPSGRPSTVRGVSQNCHSLITAIRSPIFVVIISFTDSINYIRPISSNTAFNKLCCNRRLWRKNIC